MEIAVIKEQKAGETRVALTPSGAKQLVKDGHTVTIETCAGLASLGATDEDYLRAGAKVALTLADTMAAGKLILMVKEPFQAMMNCLKPDHTVFTFFHLANNPMVAEKFIQCGATAISYDTVTDRDGNLPILFGMSEIAGKLAMYGAQQAMLFGGNGKILGGVTGTSKGNVVIIGGGVVGANALKVALGLGANVTIMDNNMKTVQRLSSQYQDRATVLYLNDRPTKEHLLCLQMADVIIGSVLNKGAKAPYIITTKDQAKLTPGTVLVDVAIDQGGCFENSAPTTHAEPFYTDQNGLIRYNVANLPAAAGMTSTRVLTNATLPFILEYAAHNCEYNDVHHFAPHLLSGFNIYNHKNLLS